MHSTPSASQQSTAHDRLESWKEIATYLNRAVRTVQRWASDSGLPVHRLATAKRGAIYAYKTEIDLWWQSRSSSLVSDREADSAPVHVDRGNGTIRRTLAIVGVAAVLIGIVARLFLTSRSLEIQSPRRLTFDGSAITPSLSPDEKWIAYASPRATSDGNLHLWLQAVDSRTVSRLTDTGPTNEYDPVSTAERFPD